MKKFDFRMLGGAVLITLMVIGLLVGSNQRAKAEVSEGESSLIIEILASVVSILDRIAPDVEIPELKVGGVTNYDSLTLDSNLIVGGTAAITGAVTTSAALTVNGLYTYSPTATATTTTGASATLVEADLSGVGYHIVTLGGAQDTSFTYTLPASTTVTSFVSDVGERAEVCWFQTASSTSAGADIIFAAGTGIDLTFATGTLPVPLGFGEKQLGCILFTRQPDGAGIAGDITAELKLQVDAD